MRTQRGREEFRAFRRAFFSGNLSFTSAQKDGGINGGNGVIKSIAPPSRPLDNCHNRIW